MDLLASSTKMKHCLLAFHMASIKYLLALNEYYTCFVAYSVHSTVLLKLLTGFFQMIHGSYDYYSVDLLRLSC